MAVPLLVAAVLILKGMVLVFIFWGGVIVGDHKWPWESDDEDDDWEFPPIPLPEEAKAGLGGLLLLGALILAATMLKGRK